MNSKKELKRLINENGFFLQLDNIQAKEKLDYDKNAVMTKVNKIEDTSNLLFFSGLASQNFDKGEKNRNGYKYDLTGMSFESYVENPLLLLQHNSEEPIGKVVALSLTKDGLRIDYFVDKMAIDNKNLHRIKNGYINGISTGAISKEEKVEDNKTGERYSIEEWINEKGASFEDYVDVMSGEHTDYTMVVTKAELVENSLVTIPSNSKALTARESLHSFFQNNMLKEEEFNKLKKNETEEVETTEVETTEEVNTETEPVEAENATTEETTKEVENTPEVDAPVKEDKMREYKDKLAKNETLVKDLSQIVLKLSAQVDHLQDTIDSIPARKAITSIPKANSGEATAQLLKDFL